MDTVLKDLKLNEMFEMSIVVYKIQSFLLLLKQKHKKFLRTKYIQV